MVQNAIEYEILEENEIEYPEVPSGLKKLTAAIEEFNNFWEIDNKLIAQLAQKSSNTAVKTVDYKKAISHLSDIEKSEFLLSFAQNEEYALQSFLKRLEN